ncbi:hypothetical protein H4R34_004369 [Dimargaris verticillata]|uniref:WSC domain-containing protein n=1 Tax=Dimargaris verticillata TaxID=2761393 RepID=A0A9W8B4B8_9FUNG|nr:hypothetical protein H4R34_004369 [Dimargaris verticillata]
MKLGRLGVLILGAGLVPTAASARTAHSNLSNNELTRRADYCAMMCKEPVLTKRGLVTRQSCESMCNEQGVGAPLPTGPAPTGSYVLQGPSGSETVAITSAPTSASDEQASGSIVIENGSEGVETLAVSSAIGGASGAKDSATVTGDAEATDDANDSGAAAMGPVCHYLAGLGLAVSMTLVSLEYIGN